MRPERVEREAGAADGPGGGSGRRSGDVVLSLESISLAFGGVKALTDISFDVREHEIRAIIGPNGAGKSSMLNVINGVYQPQQGAHRVPRRGAPPHPSPIARRATASRGRSRTSRCSRA